MVVTFGSRETEPTMLRNKRAACRDGTSADGERNNGVCGAKMPHSTQIGLVAQKGRAGAAIKALDARKVVGSSPTHSAVLQFILSITRSRKVEIVPRLLRKEFN